MQLGCHKCGRHTFIKDGVIYGITLRKDPAAPSLYVCPQHYTGKLSWKEENPKDFHHLLSQLEYGNKRKKKKLVNKFKKIKAKYANSST